MKTAEKFIFTRFYSTVYKWEITEILHLAFEAVWLEYIIFGFLMLLVLMYKHEGLIKEKPIMTGPIKSKVGRNKK